MKLKDIKTGMKVKLLGKHAAGDNYDNIEDFYDECNEIENVIKMKEQGYGIVVDIDEDYKIVVNNDFDENEGWYFLPSDIEPYEEETVQTIQEKTPKEWLMTPLAISSTRDGEEYVTLGDRYLHDITDGKVFAIDSDYDDNLNDICNDSVYCDIIKITYKDKVVWQRKEEYYTLVEAIKFNKKVKHKDWDKFYGVNDVLITLAEKQNDFILKALSEKVWEVR